VFRTVFVTYSGKQILAIRTSTEVKILHFIPINGSTEMMMRLK